MIIISNTLELLEFTYIAMFLELLFFKEKIDFFNSRTIKLGVT
jgi:hypothetical protein